MAFKKLLTASAFLILASFAAAGRHECVHDSTALQNIIAADLAKGPVVESERDKRARRGFAAQAPQPIRVSFFIEDLNDATKYCTSAGASVPDFQGGTVTCTAEDVLTAEKRSVLVQNILPAAITKLEAVLNLERVTSRIVVPSDACTHFTIPTSHGTTGVANADYVLYVAAAPTSGSTLAWAGGCRSDTSGRLVVGRANFSPRYLYFNNASIQRETIATATHELLHALGVSKGTFDANREQVTLRGKSAWVLTMPTVNAKFREFLGCSSTTEVPGVEIEDEGGAGSASSHFERRVAKDELMTAAGGEKLSALSLAVLEDIGHYTPDYSRAEAMEFGKNAGCSFVTSACNTAAGGRDEWFCFDRATSNACTKNLRAIGRCAVSTYTSNLPSYFQYFSGEPNVGGPNFIDGCPYIQAYSNRHCDIEASREPTFGHYFGTGGRCFETTGLIQSGFSSSGAGERCLETRCTSTGFLQFRVGGDPWETCLAAGQQLAGFSGYGGAVVCPNPATMCATFDTTTATTAPTTTPAPPGAPPPPPTTTTTTPAPTPPPSGPTLPPATSNQGELETLGELRFSGDFWRAIVGSREAEIKSAVKLSFAILFGVRTSDVTVNRLGIGSLVIDYELRSSLSASEVDDKFQAAIQATGSVEWYAPITAEYQFSNPTDVTRPTAHEIDKFSQICQWIKMDNDTCYVVFVGIAITLVIILLYILWRCCCGSKKEEEEEKQAAPVPAADGKQKRRRGRSRDRRGQAAGGSHEPFAERSAADTSPERRPAGPAAAGGGGAVDKNGRPVQQGRRDKNAA